MESIFDEGTASQLSYNAGARDINVHHRERD